MNRVKAYAQFNKLNKKFITVLGEVPDTSLLNHDLFLYRDIEIDLYEEVVQGDYDNYTIVAIANLPEIVTEESLNELAKEKILKVYPLEKQLSIIGGMLEKLADAAGIEATDVKDMNAYISEIRRANAIRKDFFANNPDYHYMSTEDVEAEINELQEGGINDYE